MEMDMKEVAEVLESNPMLFELMKLASGIDDREAIREVTRKLKEAHDGK